MKIYVIGSTSCGKTTLARYISKKYNLKLLPEVARLILAEKELQIDSLRSDTDLVDSYQRDIFYRQLEIEKDHKSFVSDRSFDCLAYSAEYSGILHNLFETKELKEYIDNLRKDDVYLFFVRPSHATLKQDGVRETLDWEAIIRIDSQVKFMLKLFNLKYYQISMTNMQERIDFVNAILS